MERILLLLSVVILLNSCHSTQLWLSSGKTLSKMWISDPCGLLGYRSGLSEYFLQTGFVTHNFKTEKQVKHFFGKPDTTIYSEEIKDVFIYEYVTMSTGRCTDAPQSVRYTMNIYFFRKSKKIRDVFFSIYD
ncbi:MAG TPA: hypothetical protein PLC89_07740 [Haliscomenobacter sp.]|uniref:hypothetical protein n=1 Tax=Haliscomenobacter sp. TaxID=2717303 RepID=UPI002C322A7D|nr:hypothetical protein [Haliscomenobacter sp.]HOY17167.1 hypothetical protein [Haliscomenobacter sp.]HPH20930.1 hypothetical protein [Haliscomenobacter sp.]